MSADLTKKITGNLAIGPNLPRRGNRISRGLAVLIMALFGWRITGNVPDIPKFVIIGAPHSSNLDFLLVIATASALGIRISWMAKHTLFRGPLNNFFRWMGGIPVDRGATNGIVGDTIETFNKQEKLIVCITPEGTRRQLNKWKSGFYHIALGANVPVMMAAFDYGTKVVDLGPMLVPSGDFETDFVNIKAHYAGVKPRNEHHYIENKANPT